LAYHKFIIVPYQGCYYFGHHHTTNSFVFSRYLAGTDASNFHIIFIVLELLYVK